MKPYPFGYIVAAACFPAALAAAPTASQAPSSSAQKRFRDCPECPEMVVIPAGRFMIGSPPDEPGRQPDEGPQAAIAIDRPFAVGRFEITRAQYKAFVNSTGHEMSGGCITDRRKPGTWVSDDRTNFEDPGFPQTAGDPVACVSWTDAVAYVTWLNSKSDGGYRLLSEAEWEYVVRAGSTTPYPWGASIHDGCGFMNGYDRTILGKKGNLYQAEAVAYADCSDGFVNSAPVGSFKPNAFGVHDMIGNMGEWVADCATPSYSDMRPDGASSGGDCSKRMVRGGSWGTQPRQLRSAERIRYDPTDVDDSIGMRVAKSLTPRSSD